LGRGVLREEEEEADEGGGLKTSEHFSDVDLRFGGGDVSVLFSSSRRNSDGCSVTKVVWGSERQFRFLFQRGLFFEGGEDCCLLFLSTGSRRGFIYPIP
jgi:hypothetical protein